MGSQPMSAHRLLVHTCLCLSLQFFQLGMSLPDISTHSCSGNDDQTRICRFSNLIVVGSKIVYVSGTPVTIPKMSGYRAGYDSYGPPITVLTKEATKQLLDSAESVTKLRKAALVYRMHYENWGHHMLDITATTHRVLCGNLGMCTYDEASLDALSLVFFDKHPRHEGNFKRIWGCYSRNPLIYTMQDEFKNKAYVLADTIAGWSYLSLFDGGWGPDQAKAYYERMWGCLGLNTQDTVHELQPTKVTFIQRPQHESKKARSFVNVHDVIPKLQQTFPELAFEVHSLTGKPFDEVISIFHNSSILFAVNGAAMGNSVFMRKGSVYIDIGPREWHFGFLQWTFANLGPFARIKLYMYSVADPHLKPIRWEQVAESPLFQALSKQEMIELIRDHTCPPSIESHCKADWLYTKTDFVMADHAAEHYIKMGLQDIKDFRL